MRMRSLLILTVFLAGGLAAQAQGRVEQGGVAVTFDYTPGGDGTGLALLTLTDAATGRGIEGARPAAWLLARRSEQVAAETSCEDKAQGLVAGSLGMRPDVDLNGYRLLTLNHDNTVAFINPMVSLKNTQLESIVQLPATGHDWLLAPRAQRLVVSLREAGAVALIDTVSRRLIASVATGEGSLPTRLTLDPDGQRVWVGLDGGSEVLVLDLRSTRIQGRAAVGQGVHTLVAHEQTPLLAVTNGLSNTVSLVDRTTFQTVATLPVGTTPVASAWSAAAQRLVVLSINGGSLTLIDPQQKSPAVTVPLTRGAMALGLFDEGRHAMVLNSLDDSLTMVDLAGARQIAQRKLPARPDQLTFSRDFAYVRSQSTSAMQVIALAQARLGKLDGVAVPMGRSAPQEAADAINVASVLALAPEGNGVMLANPGDGSVYRYAQGLMVPINSHSNYRRRARGLLVLDSSLAERSPGRFEAATRFTQGGHYDVVVRNQRPAVTACFTVTAQGAQLADAAPAAPKPRLVALRRIASDVVELDFELAGFNGSSAAGEVALLLVQRVGTWQGRAWAAPLGSSGNGQFRARLRGLPTGSFEAMVEAPLLNIAFSDGRLGRVPWPLPGEAAP
jgi:YVTN family beta-propeller protein